MENLLFTRSDAKRALQDLNYVEANTQNFIISNHLVVPLLVQGLVFAFIYLNTFFLKGNGLVVAGISWDRIAGWAPMVGAIVLSGYCIRKVCFASPYRATGDWFPRFRAPLLTVVWAAFYFVNQKLHVFENARQEDAYFIVYVMLLFLVLGFWLEYGPLLFIGALVSISTLLVYLFSGSYYPLWMALCVGGSLMGGGLYVRWKFKIPEIAKAE